MPILAPNSQYCLNVSSRHHVLLANQENMFYDSALHKYTVDTDSDTDTDIAMQQSCECGLWIAVSAIVCLCKCETQT